MALKRRTYKRKYTRKRSAKPRTIRRTWRPLVGYKHGYATTYPSRHVVTQVSSAPGYGSVRQPFSPTLFTMLTYSITKDVTSSGDPANINAPFQLRMNSIYDPEVTTGAGQQQPRYTSALLGNNNSTAPYRKFRVHASSIKITIWSIGTTPSDGRALVYCYPARSDITAPTSLNEVNERAYVKVKPIASMYSANPRKLKHFTKAKWHLGYKDLRDVEHAAGNYAANPVDSVYWNIGLCDVAQTGATAHTKTMQVQVTYFVEFYELGDVSDSLRLDGSPPEDVLIV